MLKVLALLFAAAAQPAADDPPRDAEVLKALPKVARGTFRDDIVIVKNLLTVKNVGRERGRTARRQGAAGGNALGVRGVLHREDAGAGAVPNGAEQGPRSGALLRYGAPGEVTRTQAQ
jgi:hypothetical protein